MHILIAGVASPTGRLLAETLLAETRLADTTPVITRVTGLDSRPCLPPLAGLHFVRARFRQPEWTPLLDSTDHPVDVVILVTGAEWPASRRRSPDATLFADTRFVIDAALAAKVRKLIVVNSAALYGTSPPNPLAMHREGESSSGRAALPGIKGEMQRISSVYLTESAPVRGHEASVYARARARIADYLDVISAQNTKTIMTRLRMVWLCGARHTALARYAQTDPVLVRGFADHALDVIHEQDAIAAIRLALHHDLPGIYNVGYGADAAGQITFSDLAALAGQEREPVSLTHVTLRAWWRWRWRGKPMPPGFVRAFVRAGPLDAQKLRAAGWSPQYTARAAVLEAFRT
ncbi:MAG: NAD-dependent epimerase/dehydratase family protein [Anaerolineae bacterium]|nr:NAD-dependent epimerase/dehydratase family protein [Anaerolineae bacterium]